MSTYEQRIYSSLSANVLAADDQKGHQEATLDPVVRTLQVSDNLLGDKAILTSFKSLKMVERQVTGLLNKLTMENFDDISDRIIQWANKSEKEKDGRTLIQIICLVFKNATNEAKFSEIYACLCRKMMEKISPNVQDDGIKNNEGKPIAGGQLFRKYLLNRCQEGFERDWLFVGPMSIEDSSASVLSTRLRSKEDGKEEADLPNHVGRAYAAQKAKRQRLGLVKFIGELFKLQMLTERIMHECVKKLLQVGNVDNPNEEEIEALCKLLTTVGSLLDHPKARARLDSYFSRVKEITKSPNITARVRFMLIDLIELRERSWASLHDDIGLRHDGTHNKHSQVSDPSYLGKISKSHPVAFGPSSVLAGKQGAVGKHKSLSCTSTSSNMFSILSSRAADNSETAANPGAKHKHLVLLPRWKPVEDGAGESQSPAEDSKDGSDTEEKSAAPEMSEKIALRRASEDVKKFFAVRSLSEAEEYFTNIPATHHHRLVNAFVTVSVESKEADAKLVADFFEQIVKKGACSAEAFEAGLLPVAEIIDDIAIGAPKAFRQFAMMIKGAGLDEARLSNLASKSIHSNELFSLVHSTDQTHPPRPAQHDVEVSIFMDMAIGLRSAKKGASLFKIIPPMHHQTFIAEIAEAALAMEEGQVRIVAESCQEAIGQGACSLKNCKKGIAMVAKKISKTTVTSQFLKLAMMVRVAGLNKVDREEIATIFGQLSGCFVDITQSKGQRDDEKTVTEFFERLVRMRICSTALLPADEKQDTIKSIVNDIASQAPDVLRKLSLIVKGGCLD